MISSIHLYVYYHACFVLHVFIETVTIMLCFHSHGQHLCKFIGTKESVYIRKESTPTGLVWDTNMATVLLFWDTNMAAVLLF